MAQYVPEILDKKIKVQINENGHQIETVLPYKTFQSGRKGFFQQGIITVNDKKYRLNLQVYEII